MKASQESRKTPRLPKRMRLLVTETGKMQEEVLVGEDRESVLCITFWNEKRTSAHQQTDGHLKPWHWMRSPRE